MVVARLLVDGNLVAKSAHPHRQNLARERECIEDLHIKGEVHTIFRGPNEVGIT